MNSQELEEIEAYMEGVQRAVDVTKVSDLLEGGIVTKEQMIKIRNGDPKYVFPLTEGGIIKNPVFPNIDSGTDNIIPLSKINEFGSKPLSKKRMKRILELLSNDVVKDFMNNTRRRRRKA